MQILGDRHYKAAVGENVTFEQDSTDQVGAITVASSDDGTSSLPVTFAQGGHHTLTVTVGFTSESGGSAIIKVTGDQGGADTSKIRQLSEPERSVIFVVD